MVSFKNGEQPTTSILIFDRENNPVKATDIEVEQDVGTAAESMLVEYIVILGIWLFSWALGILAFVSALKL